MALEALGGAFLSSLFENLFDKITSLDVISFFRRKKLNQGLLRKVKIQFLSANALVDDAETKQLGNRLVREWLNELKQAAYDAEDLMIDIGDESMRCEMEEGESSSRPSKVMKLASSLFSSNAFVTEIESKIEEILDRLKFLLDQADALGLKKGVQNRPPSHYQRSLATSLVEESGVFGRDAEKMKIIELLMSSDACDKISVISIVGMGGIGKTTLAGLVYNDDQVQKHFDVKAWVTVSDDFSVARVTKTILNRVKPEFQACDVGYLDQLQVELKEALRGKKFLVVLDDVWDENYGKWDSLRRAFESGVEGSKIIVTTRNRKIASMMADANASPYQLETISDEDCLKLFVKHALDSNVALGLDPNLEMICRKVVEKCKCLPLAIKSLAGLLRSEPNFAEWEKILKSEIWELPNEKVEIVPALWLSYYYLPPHLKRCFAYCAIFPQDYNFVKQELILLWVAENLLTHQKGKRQEEVGEEYFNDLVSRSMFQKNYGFDSSTIWGNGEFFGMHDLISDLAKYVFGAFCASLEVNDSNTSISNSARHLSSKKEIICDRKKLEALSQVKSLRTFLALPMVDGELRERWFSKPSKFTLFDTLQPKLLFTMLSLRVLSLSEYPSTELPDSIGSLKKLRYLNLSFSELERLPDTVCNLHNLQILLLSCCRNLTQLPTKIGSLINLRHLDVTKTPLKNMPADLGNLKNLQFLSDFIVGEENGSNIQQLEKLHLLHGKLRISGLQSTCDIAHISKSILRDMKCLNELILVWNDDNNDSAVREKLQIDRLRPHTNVNILVIENYRGKQLSDWLGDGSFSNITRIFLYNCENCSLLPSLGQLPSLQDLKICGFDELVKIGEEFFGNSSSSTIEPFRSLKALSFKEMPRWREWSFNSADGEGGVFPCLTRLEIFDCQQLETLISGSPQHETHTPFPSLQDIQIAFCPRLESFLEWGFFSRLESLHIWDCDKLLRLRMQWDLQRFTSLTSLCLWSYSDAVVSFPEEGLLPTTLTHLDISSFKNLKALNSKGLQQLTSLERLMIGYCNELECLPEEGLPNSLSCLHVYDCSLLKERCKRETGEDWPKIAHISEVRIDGPKI